MNCMVCDANIDGDKTSVVIHATATEIFIDHVQYGSIHLCGNCLSGQYAKQAANYIRRSGTPVHLISKKASSSPLKISLTCHTPNEGIIVPMKSGVIWENQTAGTACHHSTMEGIFIPLHIDGDGSNPVCDMSYIKYDKRAEADVLKFLKWAGLWSSDSDVAFRALTALEFDAARKEFGPEFCCEEAWVPAMCVYRRGIGRWACGLENLYGKVCIITHENSD